MDQKLDKGSVHKISKNMDLAVEKMALTDTDFAEFKKMRGYAKKKPLYDTLYYITKKYTIEWVVPKDDQIMEKPMFSQEDEVMLFDLDDCNKSSGKQTPRKKTFTARIASGPVPKGPSFDA